MEKYFRLFSLDSFKNCNLAAIKQLTMKVSKTLLLLVLTFFLVGCSQDDSEVEGTSSVLSVSVRAGSNDQVSFPVYVYVFKGESCLLREFIESAQEELSLNLESGVYDLYSVAGISQERYHIPSAAQADKSTMILLKEGLYAHNDLQAAYNRVTVGGNMQPLEIQLKRKVVYLDKISVSNVPLDATSVKVSISSFRPALCVNGEGAGDPHSFVVTLNRENESSTTWSDLSGYFLIPTAEKAQITVSVTSGSGEKSYSYTANEAFEANRIYAISGSCATSVFNLSGRFIAEDWNKTPIDLEFTLTEGGESSSGNEETDEPRGGNNETGIQVGAAYNGCCVIAAEGKQLTLLSPEDITCYFTGMESVYEMNQVMSAKLATFGAAGLSGWRVMNRTESDYVYNHVDVVNQALESIENSQPLVSGKRYLWFDGTSYFAMKLGQVMQGNDWSSSTLIRPVVTVTL